MIKSIVTPFGKRTVTAPKDPLKESDEFLTADQLDCKYNPDGGGQHPVLTRALWRTEVTADDTLLGYWDWLAYKIEQFHAL